MVMSLLRRWATGWYNDWTKDRLHHSEFRYPRSGQEQDTLDGGYDTTQCFRGTLYDLRVWNSAISDEQIATNYQHVPGTADSGLVANWRMSGLSGGNTVVDSVGGVNLSVANVAVGGSFVASTTTAGLSVAENATVGTRVGQVIGTDVDLSRDIVRDGLFREAANPGTITTYTTGQSIGTGLSKAAMLNWREPPFSRRRWAVEA